MDGYGYGSGFNGRKRYVLLFGCGLLIAYVLLIRQGLAAGGAAGGTRSNDIMNGIGDIGGIGGEEPHHDWQHNS